MSSRNIFESEEESVSDVETSFLNKKLIESEVEFRSLMVRCMKSSLKVAVLSNDKTKDVASEIASNTNCVAVDLETLIQEAQVNNDENKMVWTEKACEAAQTLKKLKHGLIAEALENHLKHIVCLVSEKVKHLESQGQGWVLKNFPTNSDQMRALKREGVNPDRIIVATVRKEKSENEKGEQEVKVKPCCLNIYVRIYIYIG